MKRFLYILFVLIVGFSVNDLQKEDITLNWNLHLTQTEVENGNARLYFENAAYSEKHSFLPVFVKSYDLENANQDFLFTLENPVFEELKVKCNPDLFNDLKESVLIEKNTLSSAGVSKIQVQILPFKKLGEKIYILKSFELKHIPVSTKSASAKIAYNWKSNSVLKNGKWVKISTSGKGIYKIPYAKLTEWGFSNPAQVKVFGSGGKILSENPAEIDFDDLNQNAVWHAKNKTIDCLFFYEPGNTELALNIFGNGFKHKNDYYANNGYFFLTEDVGETKVIEKLPEFQGAPTHNLSSYSAFELYEFDLENLLKLGSGKQWYGDKFRSGTAKNIDFNLVGLAAQSDVDIRISAVSRSFQTSEMTVLVNQAPVGELKFYKVNTSDETSVYADAREFSFSHNLQNEQFKLTLKFFANEINSKQDDNALAWLDFIEINYRKKLQVAADAMFFSDIQSVGTDNVVEYTISNASSTTKVLDVSDSNNIKELTVQLSGSSLKTVQSASEFRLHLFSLN